MTALTIRHTRERGHAHDNHTLQTLFTLALLHDRDTRENGVECEGGESRPPKREMEWSHKYGFHNQKVWTKFPLFNAFGQAE